MRRSSPRCSAGALGQADPTSAMRDLLERGYYNAAAQLEGRTWSSNAPDDPDAHYLYARAAWLTDDLTTARERAGPALALVREPARPVRAPERAAAGRGRRRRGRAALARERVPAQPRLPARDGLRDDRVARPDDSRPPSRRTPRPPRRRRRARAVAAPEPRPDPGPDRTDRRGEGAFETAIEVFERSDPGGVATAVGRLRRGVLPVGSAAPGGRRPGAGRAGVPRGPQYRSELHPPATTALDELRRLE